MKRKLTPRQDGFVKDVVELKNPTEAVRRNYDLGSKGGSKSEKQLNQTARAIACENLTKPNIAESIVTLLEKHIPREKRIRIMNEILDSDDKRSVVSILDMANKMDGSYSRDEEDTGAGNEVNIVLSKPELPEDYEEYQRWKNAQISAVRKQTTI